MPRPDPFWYSHVSASAYNRPATTDPGRLCRAPGCTRKHCYAVFDGRRVYSRYCPKHTCTRTATPEDGFHCPIPKDDGERYCPQHLKCGASECREKGEYPGIEQILPWFCRTHRCTEPLCTSGIHDFLQKRCKRHLKCAVPSCSSEPDLSLHSNLCSRHTCTYKVLGHDCAYPAVENNRCSEHKKCSVNDCERVCYKREGEDHFQDKCIIHFNRCPRPNCGRIRRDDVPYCHEHACDIANCPEYKDLVGSIYCRTHRCSIPSCLSSRRHPGTLLCVKHGCKVTACVRPTEGTGDFCKEHTCRRDKCSRQGADGVGSLCAAHKCKAPTCRGEARFEGGFCVALHGCVEADCRKARIAIPGDPDVERCLEHERKRWQTLGRRVALEELRVEFEQERDEWRLEKMELEARIAVVRSQMEREERLRRELEERHRREMEERPPRGANVRDTWGPGPRRFSYGRESRTPGPGDWYTRPGGGFGGLGGY
ncbi:hypothetical protein V8F33_010349 [Rhypophila sp. PSN 637]